MFWVKSAVLAKTKNLFLAMDCLKGGGRETTVSKVKVTGIKGICHPSRADVTKLSILVLFRELSTKRALQLLPGLS